MDKILCSVDSYEFIANWLYKNNVKINELPVVLREFTMECEFARLYGNSTWATFEPELVEYVEKEVKKKKKKGKSKSQSKLIQTQIIRLNKFVSDVKTGKKQVKRHYNKCTYSFGVKGHYRTYKSGKRVWIKPFQKNTLENRLKRSKEYTFNLKKK